MSLSRIKIPGMTMGIREKTIVPIVIILAVALLGLAVFNYYSQVSILNREAEISLRGAVNSAQSIINERLMQYQQMAALVASMPTPSQAFAQGDRKRLIYEFAPGFETLKKDFGVAQFQYHVPPATSYYRFHIPEKYGDDLTAFRHTVVSTNTKKEGTRGIEVGRGGLGLRGVMPVSSGGRHVGSVEFGGDLAPVIDEVKRVFDLDLGVLISITAESQAWPQWKTQSNKIGDYGLFYSTKAELVQDIVSTNLLDKAKSKGDDMLVTTGSGAGRSYQVALATLKDYAGQPIGYLAVFRDRTDLVWKIRKVLIANIFIYIVLLAAIVWAINNSLTSAVIDPIVKLTRAADDISMGKLTDKVEIKTDDEIEKLAKSIDRMRVSMKKLME